MDLSITDLEKAAREIRINLLKLCSRQAIHIGGDLSSADIMTVLWQYQMNYDPADIRSENRDRFILSKGHASAVTSFNQAALGCFTADEVMNEYAADGGRFSMHSCSLVNPFVEVSAGSLGHGLSVACGIAEALKLKGNKKSRVYVVMGDGEQEEGSIWEAVMNAVHYKLGNLVAVIDNNGLQADGAVDRISSLGSIAEKYRAFGWIAKEADGHDIRQIVNVFDALPDADSDIPAAFIFHTVKGKGVSFMENNSRWHTGKLTPEEYEAALREVEAVG